MLSRKTLSLLALTALSTSCTMGSTVVNGRVSVVPPAIGSGEVAQLKGGAPVAVVAGTAKDEWFVLSNKDEDRTAANLKVWSDAAAEGFARDVQTIGGKVDAGAAKKVELTVTSVTGEMGAFKCRVTVTLQVKTGDGRTASFAKDTSSMQGMVFCCGDALRTTIMEALKDSNLRAYLES